MIHLKQLAFVHSPRIGIKSYTICSYPERSQKFSVYWIWIVDCSTLEAFFRKLGSLKDVPQGQLAGKMGTVIDLMTRLPIEPI